MIGTNDARRAAVEVTFDGTDITSSIRPYLLSLTYTDSEEDQSDSLQIQLQDRDGLWLESWLNKAVEASAASKLSMSATITPENWGSGGGSLPTGRFELDSVDAGGPPATVTIKGSSLAYGSSIRQTKKTKAWENYSLSGIANEIAGNAGLTCMYEAARNPTYKRKEQTKKSDITFLSELCHDEGISLKCTDGQLVLFDQSVYEALPPVATIKKDGGRILPAAPQAHGAYGKDPKCLAYETYNLSTGAAETQYGSCRVSYRDAASGKCIEGIAKADGDDGDSEQRLEITAMVSSAGEAKALAEKHLRLHNKFNRSASFTLPGNTALVAGVTVMLEGFGGWDGKYMVKQATHTVGGGYTTKIDLRKVLSGGGGSAPSGEEEGAGSEEEASSGQTYTVKSGDNLWNIAKQHYGSGAMYTKIYEANKDLIGGNPNLIFPGQKLIIP